MVWKMALQNSPQLHTWGEHAISTHEGQTRLLTGDFEAIALFTLTEFHCIS